jgi:hypothetical protein
MSACRWTGWLRVYNGQMHWVVCVAYKARYIKMGLLGIFLRGRLSVIDYCLVRIGQVFGLRPFELMHSLIRRVCFLEVEL